MKPRLPKNKTLRAYGVQRLKSMRSDYAQSTKELIEVLSKHEKLIETVMSDPAYEHYFVSGSKLYFSAKNGKAAFSALTALIAKTLKESPDIVISGGFHASFKDNSVEVYNYFGGECKMIEIEETVKRLVPHPECVAAMKQLEDVV